MISNEVINQIIDSCDIVELISSYIPLKKAGRNFKAACPFHNEKTPSFVVSPDKQIYHCFGCNKGGNVLHFVMEYERMEFREAITFLAQRAGIQLQFDNRSTEESTSVTTELLRIHEFACDFFHRQLLNNPQSPAALYLQKRGVKDETIKRFKIGYALQQWDALMNYLRGKNINLSLIEKSGLIVPREGGGFYDRFRNRLVIPILDVKNRVIAFGARALDDSLPKYINSPETLLYSKGKNLFGLNYAKEKIRTEDYAIIVEGYFDVITPFEQGIENIFASSGTALTAEQARLIKRHTHNVVMIYDGDAAGLLASVRNLEILLEEDMHVKIACLPEGLDPDTYVKSLGADAFRALISKASDIFTFKLHFLFSLYPGNDAHQKSKIALEMLATIKKIKNEIIKSEYMKLLAEKLMVNETSLYKELDKIPSGATVRFQKEEHVQKENEQTQTIPQAEKMLIKLLLEDTRLIERVKDIVSSSELQDKNMQKILALAYELYQAHASLKTSHMITALENVGCKNIVSEITSEEMLMCGDGNRCDLLDDCVKRIKFNTFTLKCKDLQNRIKNAQHTGDHQNLHSLLREFNLLMKQKQTAQHKNNAESTVA